MNSFRLNQIRHLLLLCLTALALAPHVSYAQAARLLKTIPIYEGQQADVFRVALTSNYLLVDGSQSTNVFELRVKGTAKRTTTSQFTGEGWVFSADGSSVATVYAPYNEDGLDGPPAKVNVWSLPSLKLKRSIVAKNSTESNVCFDKMGKNLFIINERSAQRLTVVDLTTGHQTHTKTDFTSGEAASVSPDGNILAVFAQDEIGTYLDLFNRKKKMRVGVDTDDVPGSFLNRDVLQDHLTTPDPLYFSPQGDFLWVGLSAIPLKADLKPGAALFAIRDAQERALQIDKAGNVLTINFASKRLKLWDVRHKKVLAQSAPLPDVQPEPTRPSVERRVPTLTAASPDGRLVALYQGGKLRVWRLTFPK